MDKIHLLLSSMVVTIDSSVCCFVLMAESSLHLIDDLCNRTRPPPFVLLLENDDLSRRIEMKSVFAVSSVDMIVRSNQVSASTSMSWLVWARNVLIAVVFVFAPDILKNSMNSWFSRPATRSPPLATGGRKRHPVSFLTEAWLS